MAQPKLTQQEILEGTIRFLRGDGDELMGFPTVIASAANVDEAVAAFRAGATGVLLDGHYIDQSDVT